MVLTLNEALTISYFLISCPERHGPTIFRWLSTVIQALSANLISLKTSVCPIALQIPGAAQLVRMFTKTHVASKLRKIWKILGHFWNALAYLHLIEGKKTKHSNLEQCIKCPFSEHLENPLARTFFYKELNGYSSLFQRDTKILRPFWEFSAFFVSIQVQKWASLVRKASFL